MMSVLLFSVLGFHLFMSMLFAIEETVAEVVKDAKVSLEERIVFEKSACH